MPEEGDWLMGDLGNHVVGVVIAVGPGKNQNAEFHAFRVSALHEGNRIVVMDVWP